MTIEKIWNECRRLHETYGDLSPWDLCDAENIQVLCVPMGTQPGACKGFFLRRFGVSCITVNADLSRETMRAVLWHELGHALLHRDEAEQTELVDFALAGNTDVLEYEANLFAAEMMISDSRILELLKEERTVFEAASETDVPPELVDYKIRILQHRGLNLLPPLYARSNFMKDIDRINRF